MVHTVNTQTAYAKVEAETPVAKDSAAYDKQRDRKKNAAKASEANATLAGFIRLAVLDDPSAQQTVMGKVEKARARARKGGGGRGVPPLGGGLWGP